MANIGNNIKRLREAAGLTQPALAKLLNCSKQTISNYERNRREPDLETVGKMAEIFGVPVDAIMGEEKPRQSIFAKKDGVEQTFTEIIADLVESEINSRLNEKINESLEQQPKRPKWIKLTSGTRTVTDEQLDQIYYAAHLVDPVKFPLD